jgi:hypothetical protein
MSPCLVQQLFRQKIGKGLDQYLIDEVLFPMLRSRKDLPREILLDIKLTWSCNDEGQSSIIQVSRTGVIRNILPFTNRSGKNSSKRHRRSHKRSAWGSIEIVNQLRDLKHPQIRYHHNHRQDYPNTEFVLGHIFIRLDEEDQKKLRKRRSATRIQRQGHRRVEIHQQQVDLKFVNDYLEDCLTTGKSLSWGRDPSPDGSQMILSTYY